MNWIPCTSHCVYQRDGLCQLDCAAAAGLPHTGGGCVHFIPDGTPPRSASPMFPTGISVRSAGARSSE